MTRSRQSAAGILQTTALAAAAGPGRLSEHRALQSL